MTSLTYTRYELLRNLRNWRFLILGLAFPLVLYVTVAGTNRHAAFDGISFPVYFMTAMATVGTMAAVISGGARIAADRATGWTRQIRITPLSTSAYFRGKVVYGYLMALLTIVLLGLAGTALGVDGRASTGHGCDERAHHRRFDGRPPRCPRHMGCPRHASCRGRRRNAGG